MPLDVFSVHDGQIHTESINKEYGIAEHWWNTHRLRKERLLSLAIGAVPDKEEVQWPEAPRLAMGLAAQRPLSDKVGVTTTKQDAELACVSSELRDWMRESGYYQRRPFHRKGMPTYYGRSLHSSSADGTDFSSRAH